MIMERVWIYQANRFLKKEELALLEADLNVFIENWKAHGAALSAKAEILENLFLVLKVNEEQVEVSGCSVDASVHFIKSIGEKYDIDFFDRMKVAYRTKVGEIQLVNSSDLQELLRNGSISQETIVFNNLITTSADLSLKWQIPLKESWHSKVF